MTTDFDDQQWKETPDSVVRAPRDGKVLQWAGASERIFGLYRRLTLGNRLTERAADRQCTPAGRDRRLSRLAQGALKHGTHPGH
jgi:hypothetical protein